MKVMPTKKEQGFTLIELVMVIVILGILAAFALPRFANFSNEARVATINGAAGAVRSAASIAHARWVADGDTTSTSVSLDGTPVAMNASNGYPSVTGIVDAAQLSGEFDVTAGTPATTAVISLTDSSGNAINNCNFSYDALTGTATAPTVSGC
ncbi:type II secretion system protein [Marinobacter sp. chi1]|uniref:Type II secretion system protein n=1 Tax=Marinobacter suaedae TaxID=3057675 RepID=A0ABT8W4L6_9GAMM|nr:type II secretion system protein [Marinobacter sp. chi1]MDO3723187.1 type II secretion system protein [Marinobacter sp. chi1]